MKDKRTKRVQEREALQERSDCDVRVDGAFIILSVDWGGCHRGTDSTEASVKVIDRAVGRRVYTGAVNTARSGSPEGS